MHDGTLTLGELVSMLFESFVGVFGNEEVAAHATALTVGRWFLRRPTRGAVAPVPVEFHEQEIEA